MLALGLLVDLAAYIAVGVGHDKEFPPSIGLYASGFGVIYLLAHLAVRRLAPYADPLMLPIVALLNGLGLVADLPPRPRRAQTAPASSADRRRTATPTPAALDRAGLALFIACSLSSATTARCSATPTPRWSPASSCCCCRRPAAACSEVNGAQIWIRLAGFSFQPGEFAKILLVIFFAGYLVAKRDVLRLGQPPFPRPRPAPRPRPRPARSSPGWSASRCWSSRRDLGTVAAVLRPLRRDALRRHRTASLGRHRPAAVRRAARYVAYQLSGTSRTGSTIWLHPFGRDSSRHGSYQLVQGLFGLGDRRPARHRARPAAVRISCRSPKSDFIIATLGEELGLVGLMALLLIYGSSSSAGCAPRSRVRDAFGKLLAAGLAFSLALQVLRGRRRGHPADPADRPDLPFLSYGGSSLVANWVDHRAAAADQRRRRDRPQAASDAAADRRRRTGRRATQVVTVR